MWSWRSSLLVLMLSLSGGTTVDAAQEPASPSGPDDRTTTITSQKMTVRNSENKAIFEGAVMMVKGALTVHSDMMVVFFKSQDQTGAQNKSDPARNRSAPGSVSGASGSREALPTLGSKSVKLIEATGKLVTIEKSEGKATCRKAVYFGDEDKLVLTGDPIAWEKGTRVAGTTITMYLAEDRSVVEGGSRVRIEQ